MAGREVIVDGEGMVLGRLASLVAKSLLEGNRVTVVNVEKVVVSGDPKMVIDSYKRTVLGVRSHYSHKWRPKRPRSPTRIFKRTVWGMLPKGNKRGREALKRLRVYIGIPEELKGRELARFREADSSRLAGKRVELGRIAKELGWRGWEGE